MDNSLCRMCDDTSVGYFSTDHARGYKYLHEMDMIIKNRIKIYAFRLLICLKYTPLGTPCRLRTRVRGKRKSCWEKSSWQFSQTRSIPSTKKRWASSQPFQISDENT